MINNRDGIYYWKSDRPSGAASLSGKINQTQLNHIIAGLQETSKRWSGNQAYKLRPTGNQGSHLICLAESEANKYFIRVEIGREADRYMEVESRLLSEVRLVGVPTPEVIFVDSTRETVPFSYQVIEYLDFPDLNTLNKRGELNLSDVSKNIGKLIATYQNIQLNGFGLFNTRLLIDEAKLVGIHQKYEDYFFLNWEQHLSQLKNAEFLSRTEVNEIREVVSLNNHLLRIERGVLVHKDMALWNVLGTSNQVKAIIDWDDAISGDPSDDISLMACFHTGAIVKNIIEGYESIRQLPQDFSSRFWLHLLRNMVVKAVIRINGGYFDKTDDFFLIGSGEDGLSLKEITKTKIEKALLGLKENLSITTL